MKQTALVICRNGLCVNAHIDFETRSAIDIKRGAYRYAIDPSTSVLCLSYELPDGTKGFWHKWCAESAPTKLFEYIKSGGLISAHNAEFEYCIWNLHCVPTLEWPPLPLAQLYCNAAACAALALPRALDGAGEAINADVKKDKAGNRIMLRVSRPRKPTKNDSSIWDEDVKRLEATFEYCDTDVEAEAAISRAIPPLPKSEVEVWRYTTQMNERGIYCDVESCKTAVRFLDQFNKELTAELIEITGGEVQTVKQTAKMLDYLATQNVYIPNLQAPTVAEFLRDYAHLATPKGIRVLELRQLLGKASVAKFQAMLGMAGPDNRIRGTLLYHGASTGRYAGRGIQPQNYIKAKAGTDLKSIFQLLEIGDYEFFKTEFPDLITALSSSLRGMLRAAPGHVLFAGDFNAIEARVILWLAGDEENLNVFTRGEDPYREMAAFIFGVPISQVTGEQRTIGKSAVLGCGFGMGWERYKGNLKDVFQIEITEELAKKAVDSYREKCYMVKNYWFDLNNAAKRAVTSPGHLVKLRNLQFLKKGRFLFIRLPSGRCLAYADPMVKNEVKKWGVQESLSYMAVHPKTRQWVRESTYGGKLAENITQAVARDIMVDSMLRLEGAGYRMIFTVHDECVAEVPIDFGHVDEFSRLMAQTEPWAKGLPVRVDSYCSERYKK